MDIQDLNIQQLKDTRQNQISFQATIKKRLKKHGFDRENLTKDLDKDISQLSKRMVNNALTLGLEWLG